jgi:hypothetical protein
MSGTITNRSIMEFWHLLIWCLKEGAPIPLHKSEALMWADAIDVIKDQRIRPKPGALLTLCDPKSHVGSPLDIARTGFKKRLIETPGVILSHDKQACDASIIINKIKLPLNDDLKTTIKQVRETWEDPQGDVLMQAVDVWRISRELGLGFFYKWRDPAPKDWLTARSSYRKFCRHLLTYSSIHHTPGDITDHQDKLPDGKRCHEYDDWIAIKDIFRPTTIAHWLSKIALEYCAEWLAKHKQICWVEQREFGEQLSSMTGYPYFGSDEQHHFDVLSATGPIICSIKAHGTGKNFQDRYSRGLVTCSPSTSKGWEQLIGRTHRVGQAADEVTFDVLLPNADHKRCFAQACTDADWVTQSTGSKQKLNIANIL